MDSGDDFRSAQARETIIKALEATLKERPLQNSRFNNDPRQLEDALFRSSATKEDYMKKVNKILQLAGQQPPQPVNYDASGGGRRVAGPTAAVMMAAHRINAPDDPMGSMPPQQQHYSPIMQPNPYAPQPGPMHRMVARMAPAGMRIAQPGQGIVITDGQQRYPGQQMERPMQPQQAQRYVRPMQPGMHWPGGGQPGGNAPVVSDNVTVNQFVPATTLRHPMVPVRTDTAPSHYQPPYSGPRPGLIPGPQLVGVATGSPRMFPRHPQPTPAQLPGHYPPMSSPNTGSYMGPSPVAAPSGPSLIYGQDQPSPGNIGSVGPKLQNIEPSLAAPVGSDGAVLEDPGYIEKIQELQMYLEPLKRLLEQHQKDGDRNSTQSQKLLRIIDIIEGRSKVTLDLLLKCEETLKKMVHKVSDVGKSRESAMCQPLFDVVASLMKSSSANQTLKRAFHWPPLDVATAKRLCASKRTDDQRPRSIEENYLQKVGQLRLENGTDTVEGTESVPVSIQREVASLETRFKIEMTKGDSLRQVQVVCNLQDLQLPLVPALRLQIPTDYPLSSPKYDCDFVEYSGSPFMDTLREMLVTRLTKLGVSCSITSVLDNWESVVRQACLSQ